MAGSTISTTISNAVTLGSGAYLSPLTVTSTGEIDSKTVGIIVPASVANGVVVNDGSIIGGVFGVDLAAGQLTNAGYISGVQDGVAVYGSASALNSGSIHGATYGLYASGGHITNAAGGYITSSAEGVRLQRGDLVNSGTITGLSEGVQAYLSTVVNTGTIDGKYGVDMTDGTLINSGTITGRTAVFAGYTSQIRAPETVANSGLITASYIGMDIRGSATNTGTIASQDIGVVLAGANLANQGTITAQKTGASVNSGTLDNSGRILALSTSAVGVFVGQGYLDNTGYVLGKGYGVESQGKVENSGSIYGSVGVTTYTYLRNTGGISALTVGVKETGGTVQNSGSISASVYGVMVSNAELLTSGTISGGKDAVYGSFITLAVNPGAVFNGNVDNVAGQGLLELGGYKPARFFGIGYDVTGFTSIAFGKDSTWTVSGDAAGLAAGQVISGFTTSDTIVVNDFGATSDTYVPGIGLELNNGPSTVTLDITGSFATGDFYIANLYGKTTIAGSPPPQSHTISHHLTGSVTLGGGVYINPLTITHTGGVVGVGAAGGVGVSIASIFVSSNVPNATIINDGTISANTNRDGPAHYYGVLARYGELDLMNSFDILGEVGVLGLGGGTIDNSGEIFGGVRLMAEPSSIRTFYMPRSLLPGSSMAISIIRTTLRVMILVYKFLDRSMAQMVCSQIPGR